MSFEYRVLTLEDIERFYKGLSSPFYGLLEVRKATGTVSTSTTGYFNVRYGAQVWTLLNTEANIFAALPKSTWVRSGWRVKTAFASDYDSIAISETGSYPAAVYPTIQTIYTKPKIVAEKFEVTLLQDQLAKTQDDIWGAAHQVRQDMGVEFAKLINQQLGHAVDSASPGNRLYELDRVVACAEEEGTNYWNIANAADIYGIDRSANSWADSYVNKSADGTARDLTDEIIRDLIAGTRKRGAYSTFWLTGIDTYAKMIGLYTTFVRYNDVGEMNVTLGIQGVKTDAGARVGLKVASLYGMPVIAAVDAPAESSGIQELFLLDTSDPEGYGLPRLSISVLRPVEYYETTEQDMILLDKPALRGVYQFIGELIARNMYVQGKARDLQ